MSERLARFVEPHIEFLIFALLIAAAVRINPIRALGALSDIRNSLVVILVLQIAMPLVALALLRWTGISDPLYLAVVLVLAAPAVSGSPHIVTLLGFDAAVALRMLVVGTLLLPLTILPVFYFIPELGPSDKALLSALRLAGVIAAAIVVALLIRRFLPARFLDQEIEIIDGISSLILGVVVFGLMAAVHGEAAADPGRIIEALVLVIGLNIGLQFLVSAVVVAAGRPADAVSLGVIAGNRNIALFLTSIALVASQPVLLLIACYQIPMYLTPIVMRPWYRWLTAGAVKRAVKKSF